MGNLIASCMFFDGSNCCSCIACKSVCSITAMIGPRCGTDLLTRKMARRRRRPSTCWACWACRRAPYESSTCRRQPWKAACCARCRCRDATSAVRLARRSHRCATRVRQAVKAPASAWRSAPMAMRCSACRPAAQPAACACQKRSMRRRRQRTMCCCTASSSAAASASCCRRYATRSCQAAVHGRQGRGGQMGGGGSARGLAPTNSRTQGMAWLLSRNCNSDTRAQQHIAPAKALYSLR